jgi:hypothetical protein
MTNIGTKNWKFVFEMTNIRTENWKFVFENDNIWTINWKLLQKTQEQKYIGSKSMKVLRKILRLLIPNGKKYL